MTREDAEKGQLKRQEQFIDRYEKMVNDMRDFIAASGYDAEDLRKNKALSYLMYVKWCERKRLAEADEKEGLVKPWPRDDATLDQLIELARAGALPSPESVTRILRLLTSKTLEGEQIEELARQAFVAPENIEDWDTPLRGRNHQYDLGPREDR